MEVVQPSAFWQTFDRVRQSMTLNESVYRLERDEQALVKIFQALKDMGQTRFVPLAKKSADAMVSVPLYAGDGLVIKVIPKDYSDHSTSQLFKLPPITVQEVEGKNSEFFIKTYPWISPRGVTQESIEKLRQVLGGLGLIFNDKDDQPRNIHRLPDRNGTLISIDEDIYHGRLTKPELSEAWQAYVHSIFPVYASAAIKPQSENTDYSFVSIHDRQAERASFDGWQTVEVDTPGMHI